ncbi:hypothetical protein HB847_12485 [Listeria booriae]|uniref:Uncharacterized protein n=1 Tax=Listeria booriae TaxID=1552123 RepID=A0A841Y508_9LIST|nr:type II toxin-antitoxin system RelE/ParE family toxin [Listeria booriae]MBC1373186.1 hypothetical protein [Listeria booriae]
MGLIQLHEFPNLWFDNAALTFLQDLETQSDRRKVLTQIAVFDLHGYDRDVLGKQVEYIKTAPYRGLIELKVKISSKREVRLLIVKVVPKGISRQYVVVHAFIKTTQKLSKREGYL